MQSADLQNRILYLPELPANCETQVELLPELGLGDAEPRIGRNLERLSLTPAVHRNAYLVLTRQCDGPLERSRPHRRLRYGWRARVAHVPNEPVHAGVGSEHHRFRAAEVLILPLLVSLRLIRIGKRANDLAGGIEDLDLHPFARAGVFGTALVIRARSGPTRQVVVDHHAGRRVGAV